MTKKKRRIIFYLSAFVFLVIATGILMYSLGYTIDESFKLSRRGGLYIGVPVSDAKIFINNEEKKTIGFLDTGYFISNLRSGDYSILVAKDGYWPWAKNLNVKEGVVNEAAAFLFPKEPKGEVAANEGYSSLWISPDERVLAIKKQSPTGFSLVFYSLSDKSFLTFSSVATKNLLTFKNISRAHWKNSVFIFTSEKGSIKAEINLTSKTMAASYNTDPVEDVSEFEKITNRGDQKIWWDPASNKVFVDWLKQNSPLPYYVCGDKQNCILPVEIFQSSAFPVKDLDFFPDRKDVIILAVGPGVYALEIDGRDGRLVYPIYKGKEPSSFEVNKSTKSIYLTDEGALIRIVLE